MGGYFSKSETISTESENKVEPKNDTTENKVEPKKENTAITSEKNKIHTDSKIDIDPELLRTLEKIDEDSRFMTYFRFAPRLMKVLRPLAYASEVGESFRNVVAPKLVKLSYGLSIAYVVGDVGIKVGEIYVDKKIEDENKRNKMIMWTFGDQFLFHTSASLIAPAVIIHQTVKRTGQGLEYLKNNKKFMDNQKLTKLTRLFNHKHFRLVPTVIGLCTIPFIIKPIDNATDWVLYKTLRTLDSQNGNNIVRYSHDH